jgi:shikimate kinase
MSLGSTNIYLIGHRGVGKSTVAPLAASLMNRRFLDLDVEIERNSGASIQSIFAQQGESAFREFEAVALADAASERGLIVATGGGAVLREDNRKRLRDGFCIWMRATRRTIVERLKTGGRPPLTNMTLEDETAALLAVREPLYQSLAQLVIDVDFLSRQDVVEKIQAVGGVLQ